MPPIRYVQIFRLSLMVFLKYLLVQSTVDVSGKCLCYSASLLSNLCILLTNNDISNADIMMSI